MTRAQRDRGLLGRINVDFGEVKPRDSANWKKSEAQGASVLLESAQDFKELRPMSKQKLHHISGSPSGQNEGRGTEPESKAIERIKFNLLSRSINERLGSIHSYPLDKCLAWRLV